MTLRHLEAAYNGTDLKVIQFLPFIEHLSLQRTNSEEYWKAQLSNPSTSTYPNLPSSDFQTKACAFATLRIDLPQSNFNEIMVSTILRAAWAVVMATYAGTVGIVFGSILSGRNSDIANVESIVGPLFTTVPICLKIDPKESVQEFLHRVQTQAVDMMPHENFGLQNIARLSETSKIACNFQNIFVIQPGEAADTSRDESIGEWVQHADPAEFHTYPMTMQCKLHPNYIELKGGHDERLIDTRQMRRLMYQFKHVLFQLCTLSMRAYAIEEIEVCSMEDKREIAHWNQSTVDQHDVCVHSLISRRAREAPLTPAVNAWDGTLTYAELEDRSNMFCQHLLSLGVKPGMKIPLLFEPSLWVVVAMLGVAKSGAAFTVIDAHCPQGRMEQIVKDLDAEYIICSTQTYQTAKLFALPILLNMLRITSLQAVCTSSLPQGFPEDTLYIIYTSGSTGRPKGCIIQHGAYASSALAHAAALNLNSTSRVLQFAAYAFDASILEILTTLVKGGCVCIPSKEEKENSLVQIIRDMNVNWALLTPSLIDIISPQDVPTLQVLVLGGEPIRSANIKTWAEAVWLCNAYGPSEASVVATVNSGLTIDSSASMIGRSVGSHSWIVNPKDSTRLAPIGVVGELLIEGPILSAGYLHNAKHNKAAFIEGTSFLDRRSQRRYKTGDLVRYDSDGFLHFVRRKDDQVKLRGQRFEPGETENVLKTHESIRQCIVAFPRIGQCKNQLCAILSLGYSIIPAATVRNGLRLVLDTSDPGVRRALQEISESLTRQLPVHMIPTIWLIVDQIPLSISGKLDKNAAIEFVATISAADARKGRELWDVVDANHCWTPIELQLKTIWSEVLNIPKDSIKANSSFLSQGGDSISAMQLVSRCRATGIAISVQDVLQLMTITKIATRAREFIEFSNNAPSISPERLDEDFALSPVQAMFFNHMPEGNNLFQQGFCLNIQTEVSSAALRTVIERVVNHHSMLRARFRRNEDTGWSQRIVSDARSSFVLIDSKPQSRSAWAILQARQAIDIQKGPLISAAIIGGEKNQRLYITAHHLVVDLVSWRIILKDMEDLLKGYEPRPTNNVHFQGLMEILRNPSPTLSSSVRNLSDCGKQQLENYWGLSQYKNIASECLVKTFRFCGDVVSLLFGSYKEQIQLEPLDIMLGSLIYSFQRTFKDRGPPLIINESHGRDTFVAQPDVSGVVGWFTALYPIAVQMNDDDSLFDIAKRVSRSRQRLPKAGANCLSSLNDALDKKQDVEGVLPTEILFNFTGRFQQLEGTDSLFTLSKTTPEEAAAVPRHYQQFAYFEISADCSEEYFDVSFQYHKNMRHQDRIATWIQEYQACILEAVGQISKPSFQTEVSLYPLWTSSRALLAKLLTSTLPSIGIGMEDVEDIYPCTPMQLEMLESQSQNPELFFDRISFNVKHSNEQSISIDDVSHAWTEVAKHHATLRTIFIDQVSSNVNFVSVVLRNPEVSIAVDTQISDNQIYALFNTPTAKSRPPHLLNIRQGVGGTINCDIYISHVILDGASMPALFEDFNLALRNQFQNIERPSYQSFLSHMNQHYDIASIEYWANNLSNIQPCHLPSTIAGPDLSPQRKYLGKLRYYPVTLPSHESLKHFCSLAGVTITTLFHTTWALTLRHFVNQPDISFSYLVSGRDQPFDQINHLIGLVISRNICRVNISTDETFSTILQKMHRRDLASLPHQHVSFGEIREWLKDLPGGPLAHPLVNTMVNYRKWAKPKRIQGEREAGRKQEKKSDVVFKHTHSYDPWDVSLISLNL